MKRSSVERDALDNSVIEVMGNTSGYLHAKYADSLAEFGRPLQLPRCGGWLLKRPISGTAYHDAMGCYPLFCCQDWSALDTDLEEIAPHLVSLVIVTDPFANIETETLRTCFDQVIRFKDHFVAELDQPAELIVKKSHRATVRKALRHVDVAVCPNPEDYLEEWVGLFDNLVRRHSIRGVRAFSKKAFAAQLSIPGMVMFEARSGNELIGLDLWYVQGDVGYGHLVAFSEKGYKLRASYATKWHVMQYFQGRVRWLHLGAAAGKDSKSTGLADFKQGWATGTKPAFLCMRTFNKDVYDELSPAGQSETNYFPAYRHGELA